MFRWYRAHIEQLFAHLWHWGLARNIWCDELHKSVHILLHFSQFCIRRQVHHPPYGPWNHVPPHLWMDKSNSAATQDEGEDEAEVCALCCHMCSTISMSVKSTIVVNVLTPALVGILLVMRAIMSDIFVLLNSQISDYATCFAGFAVQCGLLGGFP